MPSMGRILGRVRSSRRLRVAPALVALGFVGFGLARHWDESATALGQLSWWAVTAAVGSVLAGLWLMLVAWQVVLAGMGSPLPMGVAARVLFVGQLGKYVPGSVWAFAAMMELARDHGSPPRRTFSATTVALIVSLGCAIALSAATLPFTSQDIARRAWYLALLVPLIVIGLHPKVMSFGLGLLFKIARREPLEQVPGGAAMLRAGGWTLVGWLLYGVHIWVLLIALVPGDGRYGLAALYLMAVGAYGLSWATGLLVVVAPGGIGVREFAMVAVLTPVLGAPRAWVVAVLSRLAFTFADVASAGLGFLLGRAQAAPQAESSVSTYAAQ